jgi:hypothetical protein
MSFSRPDPEAALLLPPKSSSAATASKCPLTVARLIPLLLIDIPLSVLLILICLRDPSEGYKPESPHAFVAFSVGCILVA